METICSNSTVFFICLTVELPQIVFITPSLSVYPGETVQLFCKTDADSGHNFGSVSWLNENDYVMSNSSILTIADIKEESSGVYTCRSTNMAGSAEKSTSVHVMNPPEWVAININRSALINNTVVCPICTAGLSDPPSHVNWTLNRFGRILPEMENTTSILHTNEKNGYVVQNRFCFTLFKSQHDGLVLNCDVFYSSKKVKSQSVLIEVKYPPYLNDAGLAHLMIARDVKVQLSCPVIPGRPYGSIEWLNLSSGQMTGTGSHSDNSLEIVEKEFLQDKTIFCCRKNAYGGRCFTFNTTVVSRTTLTSFWPESYYPKQADFVTFSCKFEHDQRNPVRERDVIWDISKLGSANHNWTMRRERFERLSPTITISRLTVLYTHSLFGQNISCFFRQPYQPPQQKRFSFAHVIEPPMQVWMHKLQLSTHMFWHWSGNYQIRYYQLTVKQTKDGLSRDEVLQTGTTIRCEEADYPFSYDSFGNNPQNHLEVIIQACDNFSCSVPSNVYPIDNRFAQNLSSKTANDAATITNEYVVNANTNAVLTFQQGPREHNGRSFLTILIYSCVLIVFIASLMTSAFAFCLLHKFGRRRSQSALTCQSVLCENQYQLPNDDPIYFQRSAPYTCTLEAQRPENHGTLSRKIQFV